LDFAACAGLLGRQDPATADKIMENDVLAAMLRLVHSSRRASVLCGLRTLASLALASDSVAARLLTPPLSQQLQVTCQPSGLLVWRMPLKRMWQ